MKDKREKKKEETRVQNAQLHAVVSVAGVVAAVAAGSVGNGKVDKAGKLDLAVASAATLVAGHCVDVAEGMGVERDKLASVVGSAVNVRCSDDVLTFTAAAAATGGLLVQLVRKGLRWLNDLHNEFPVSASVQLCVVQLL